ncbi:MULTISPECIES: hypothetical protein [Streptomyces]|uniref:C2H2-type domain-containing protein n=1 Tax=Streptomyces bottropensis ATCC 25435 TaxID=1054862 RepID=M3FFR4_9ACTN|nr:MULTISPECIES: hypothetical protein [Streptomyces]EMF50834.1 hypothetical protein SBD_7551 [Streptomyces bottropensis ATCC 25435]MZD21169.1 hypothetical protein [Streptomyces sp. SID5476]
MTEIAERAVLRDTATAVVHESYSFACMRCGHGWEQSYEIEHHNDAQGRDFVMYVADGKVVPSPLSRPACQNCDGHVVRIMRAGQVSSVRDAEHRRHVPKPRPAAVDAAEAAASDAAEPGEHHHWHFSDLLHPFHRKAS